MRRFIAAASLVAIAGSMLLGGCVTQYPGSATTGQGYYAPYDPETNPACGALGTCAGGPLRLNNQDLHGGGG